MRSGHIHWTESERSKLLDHAAKLIQTNNFSILDAVRHAQTAVLSTDRHRNLQSISVLGTGFVHQLKQRASITYQSQPWEPPITESVPTTSRLDDLVMSIAEYIADSIKTEIRKAVVELEHEFRLKKHNPEVSSEIRLHKPKIVVIGLLPHQEHSISGEFMSLSFYFMSTDYANRAPVVDADVYLLMKNFINHTIYERYKPYPQHVLIDGGLTTLRTWLANYVRTNGEQK